MDDDIPEREELTLQETLTCVGVQMRYLCRSAGRAAARLRDFAAAVNDVNSALGELNDSLGELD